MGVGGSCPVGVGPPAPVPLTFLLVAGLSGAIDELPWSGSAIMGRRWWWSVIVVLVSALSLAGCGGYEPGKNSDLDRPKAPVPRPADKKAT